VACCGEAVSSLPDLGCAAGVGCVNTALTLVVEAIAHTIVATSGKPAAGRAWCPLGRDGDNRRRLLTGAAGG
jgi:hypothetical protein